VFRRQGEPSLTVPVIVLAILAGQASAAIFTTPFGPNGEGGSLNGQVLFFGSGGEVFELDSFLGIAGSDLNGALAGTSAQLSVHDLPFGLDFQFSTSNSPDGSDLTLTYRFANQTGAALSGVWFGFFVDAEIEVPINDYFNEAGFVVGSPGIGPSDAAPDSWEIDEPGYVFGDIFSNLLNADLDNTNAVPFAAPDDVAMALGFSLGGLPPNHIATIRILLSDDGENLGGLTLQHFDADPESTDFLTVSGTAQVEAIPELGSMVLLAVAVVVASVPVGRKQFVRRQS
jgi:hypothetical protein